MGMATKEANSQRPDVDPAIDAYDKKFRWREKRGQNGTPTRSVLIGALLGFGSVLFVRNVTGISLAKKPWHYLAHSAALGTFGYGYWHFRNSSDELFVNQEKLRRAEKEKIVVE